MSDDSTQGPVKGTEDPQLRAAEAVLDYVDGLAEPPWSKGREERAYLELFGVLPEVLEPVQPSAELRAQILAAVAEEARGGSHVLLWKAETSPAPTVASESATGWGFAQLAAAVLAVLCFGLMAAAALLLERLGEERSRFAQLETEVAQLRDLGAVQERIEQVALPGVEVCALRPIEGAVIQPEARALLYVSGDRASWMLAAERLEPSPGSMVYVVWFETGDGMVHGGSFEVEGDEPILLSSESFPADLRSVRITLESTDTDQPEGPTVLFGDEGEQML